jgi:hypothetical protein
MLQALQDAPDSESRGLAEFILSQRDAS